MDGYETSCHIRDQEKEAHAEEAQEKLRHVPIVAVRGAGWGGVFCKSCCTYGKDDNKGVNAPQISDCMQW